MELLSFENFISLIIVFVSWILVIFLLTAKTKNYKSNVILALFFIVNAQDSSGLFAHFFVYPKYPGLGMLINATVFFKMPLLFMYFLSVIYSDFTFKRKHLWHLLPWVLNLIVLFPRYFAVDFEGKEAFLAANSIERFPEIKISYLLVHLQIVVYLIMSLKLIRNYKFLLLENYSNANLFNYKWLFQLVLLFAIEALIATLKNVFMFLKLETAYFYTFLFTEIVALGFMCWIVLKALHNPELFRGVNSNLQLVRNLVIDEIQMADETGRETKEIEDIVKLKNYMKEKEPFLNASLTIYDLSKQMNIPVKELSLLINRSLNQHFFDFINSYRIKKAMEILKDPAKKEITVLEILYEVGFNSKSSFNTVFKKQTELTPSQYRKKHLKSLD